MNPPSSATSPTARPDLFWWPWECRVKKHGSMNTSLFFRRRSTSEWEEVSTSGLDGPKGLPFGSETWDLSGSTVSKKNLFAGKESPACPNSPSKFSYTPASHNRPFRGEFNV